MSNIQIGARLRDLRKNRHLTQRQLAEYLKMTPAGYGKFESGDRGLSPEYCISLAEYYGVTCDYILRGVEAEHVNLHDQTCLSPKTINILVEQRKRYNKYACASKAHEIDDQVKGELLSVIIINYIFCAIVEDKELSDYLVLAGLQIEYQTWKFLDDCITCAVNGEVDINKIPREKIDNYRTALAAWQYKAIQSFSNFFSALSCNLDFVCCCNEFCDNQRLLTALDSEFAKEFLKLDWM